MVQNQGQISLKPPNQAKGRYVDLKTELYLSQIGSWTATILLNTQYQGLKHQSNTIFDALSDWYRYSDIIKNKKNEYKPLPNYMGPIPILNQTISETIIQIKKMH